ncbi:g-protein coupled receptor [Holotrichia oblita]|uniref:G-protein coupled receptor n=1 Tax=Holotrichia oblita TaxID=644536 RepID=A0ACB9SUF3_HOLOL|nr:g-protein coupled receptor [Holotrichia oblita]
MDLVFVIRTIQNYLTFVPLEKELGIILMDVSNILLNLPESFISEANLEDNSCDKLIKSLERIGNFTPSPLTHKSNIALEIFPVKQDTFTGLTCTWYINPSNRSNRMFYCVTTNQSGVSSSQEKVIEASIQIPPSLFYHLREQDILVESTSHNIFVAMFLNSKLFPTNCKKERIVSDVVGIKLDGLTIKNLTEPIYIMFRTPASYSYETSHPVPVWWDPSLNNGTGGWSTEGCLFNTELQDSVVFQCKQLGYYGLRQDITERNYAITIAKFKFSHPAVYIGSFMLFLCLFLCILTYLLCSTGIQMPKKSKHSLVNTWIAIVLLTFFYVFGIYQTEDVKLCQAIGLILHYLTLSSLLWMCVGINSMYKRLRKNDRIELQDDELPSDEPIQKPILGLYFVGWGVALIVCGISAAVNMKEYSSNTHCFLSSEPALSALYVPFTILVIILCVFFLLVRCAMYNIDTGGHLSECTQATENVDIDLLEPSFPHVDIRSVRSISSKTGSSDIEDPEHSPIVQLKASVIFLALYMTTWLSCAIATVQPQKLKSYEDIFCIAYAGFATILGSFTLFFYCIARNDVRTCWLNFHKNLKKKCFRSRIVSDTSRNVPQIQIQPLPPIPTEELHVTSRSSSRSSHTKSNSHNSNILKGAADLNHPNYESPGGVKINNVNLVVLHRQQYRNPVVPNLIENPTNSAEMFYNPHQSTVARRFFRKQKQNLMKRNNLQTKRAEFSDNTSIASIPKQVKDNSSIDQSIFGTNTKVNNTNIHVEKIRKTKHKNPNILLDSCEDVDQNCEKTYTDKKRRDLNRQRHKKKQNVASTKSSMRENNMRSVSQQCTLEYSSETISDSILDQKSPEKSIQDVFRRDNSPTLQTLEHETPHYSRIDLPSKNKRLDRLLDTLYEPSEASFSVVDSEFNETPPKIYVNPSHDLTFPKRVQSRASSVSASEIDELYQEIRRGNKFKRNRQVYRYCNNDNPNRQASPCFSDSEITSGVSEIKFRHRTNFFTGYHEDDKFESAV